MSDYKTFNGLMKHMRDNNSLSIGGSLMKKQLMNMGYFHGYKGYRYFSSNRLPLPFTTFSQINETFILDLKLKTLFYEKCIFIETALKNRVLEQIMKYIGSSKIFDMYNLAFENFNTLPITASRRTRENIQKTKLTLQSRINHLIDSAYKENNIKVTHFYESSNYNGNLPLWAAFELLTFGVFGDLVKSLRFDLRLTISNSLNIPQNYDSDAKFLQNSIYLLRGLRNTVAHNEVCYDSRFRNSRNRRSTHPSSNLVDVLKNQFSLNFVHFNDIADYVALICYLLKLLGVSRKEIKKFVANVINIYDIYLNNINNTNITNITMPSGMLARLRTIRFNI